MKTIQPLIIIVSTLKGERLRIKMAGTLKQAIAYAKKEARAILKKDGIFVMINIQIQTFSRTETLAYIGCGKLGQKVEFSERVYRP